MSMILPIVYVLFFIFLIYKVNFFDISGLSRNTITAIFILKIIAGTVLWWLYTYYYPGPDFLDYFNDGHTLFNLLFHNPKLFFQVIFQNASYPELHSWNDNFEHVLYNDSHTMIVLNMLLHFFSVGYFHVHTVFMCFLSLLGLAALYKTFLPYFLDGKKLLLIVIFLIPSVLFWSSGVLKEGLLFFGMGMLLYITNCGLAKTYNLKKISMILFSIVLLLLVKFYVLVALFPGLVLNLWISRTSTKLVATKYIVIIFAFVCETMLLKTVNNDYYPLKIISEKQAKAISEAQGGVFLENKEHFVCIPYEMKTKLLQQIKNDVYVIKNNSTYLQWDQNNMKDTTFINNSVDTAHYTFLYEVVPAKTTLKLDRLEPNMLSLISNAPKVFINVFIQPLIWNVKGIIQLVTALENSVLILLIFLTIVFFNIKPENKPMIYFCLSFAVILFILIGITTPVIGAMVRYKVPALPFLCIGLLLLMDKKKMVKRFPFLSKWMDSNT